MLPSATDCNLDPPSVACLSVLNSVTLTVQLLCDSSKLYREMERFCYNLDSLVVEKGWEQREATVAGAFDIDIKGFFL